MSNFTEPFSTPPRLQAATLAGRFIQPQSMSNSPNASLALPTYVLPLNFDFASVLGLDLRYAFQILEIDFLFGQISEQREWLRTITLMLCASLCCSSVMKAEKDASEAIRSGQATILHQAGVECGKIINQQD